VLNYDLCVVTNGDSRARHQLRVQGVELVWVRIRPEGHTGYTPYHPECVLEGVYHINAVKAICPLVERQLGCLAIKGANCPLNQLKTWGVGVWLAHTVGIIRTVWGAWHTNVGCY